MISSTASQITGPNTNAAPIAVSIQVNVTPSSSQDYKARFTRHRGGLHCRNGRTKPRLGETSREWANEDSRTARDVAKFEVGLEKSGRRCGSGGGRHAQRWANFFSGVCENGSSRVAPVRELHGLDPKAA